MKKYLIDNKELMKEWDYEKNINLDPSNITLGVHKLVWWICPNGHSYESYVYTRVKGHGCPYCAGQKPIIGVNDFKTLNPNLIKEWDFKKNKKLLPENYTSNSGKKVWWICKNGHEFESTINNRVKGHGCPYCAGNKVIKGENDLATLNPKLLDEWDYEKNSKLNILPESCKNKSSLIVWWKCPKCNYSWKAKISNRVYGYNPCPHCDSIEVKNPLAVKEWDYEKNEKLGIDPSTISWGSSKKVWWICSKCGNQWKSSIVNRAKGSGCPKCNSQTSFPEQALIYYISKLFPDAENRYIYNGIEIDIFIPLKKIGIEYDGVYYHTQRLNSENKKDLFCEKNGIKLFRVREQGLNKTQSAINVFRKDNSSYEDLDETIKTIIDMIGEINSYDIDTRRDEIQIVKEYKFIELNKSFGKKHKDLLIDWNYDKNKGLDPYSISEYSKILLNWKCNKCGKEWKATASMRSRGRKKCPYCSSLSSTNNSILKEWDYDKNKITPDSISINSGVKVWWKCNRGHEWEASIANRIKGTKCPYCSGNNVIKGENDLATVNPELLDEWDYESNNKLDIYPDNIKKSSGKKVNWICKKCGYHWISSIANRNKGRGCPICARKKAWNTRKNNNKE